MVAADEPSTAISIAKQGIFFVGGEYIQKGSSDIRVNQMYVQYQLPAKQLHDTPLVLVHGGDQTDAGYITTPDGREA